MTETYEDLLQKVWDEGEDRPDRTNTGTISLFGGRIRYNLKEGFPLITSKKVFFDGAVKELAWFLSGSTNERELREKGVKFWGEWARRDGGLGPVYGLQLRNLQSFRPVTPTEYEAPDATKELPELKWHGSRGDRNARNTYGVGYLGEYDESDPHVDMLKETWRQMIRRCYDSNSRAYSGYGGAGVSVSEDWLCFANFQRDAKRLPGWQMKVKYPAEYSIDKDVKLASNQYNAESCIWASDRVQWANKSNTRPFWATSPEGDRVAFTSIGEASREAGLNLSAVHRCLTGDLRSHHGWTDFEWFGEDDETVWRYIHVDQFREVLTSLELDPFSRRHVITLWNPEDLHAVELATCHGTAIQFYVREDDNGVRHLSIQVYQRSADMFLGVPINIASYALLTHLIAHHLGYEVDEMIWIGGDCHIYSNHYEQVQQQLAWHREEPIELPDLKIIGGRVFDENADLTPNEFDIEVHNYRPRPALRAPVAV